MDLFASFLKQHPLSSHHVDSFLDWQYFGLPKTLKSQKLTSKNRTWTIIDCELEKPEISFKECIQKNLTYESKLVVTWKETNNVTGSNIYIPKFVLATLPMIIMPHEAPDGVGGYFVIKGIERVLISQIRAAYNQPMCFYERADLRTNKIKAEANGFYKSDIVVARSNIRSLSEGSGHSCRVDVSLTQNGQCMLECSAKFKGRLNVGLVLKALGCISMEDYLWACGSHEAAKMLRLSSFAAATSEDAIDILSNQIKLSPKTVAGQKVEKREKILHLLLYEVWPHLGFDTTIEAVVIFLGSIVSKLVKVRRSKCGDNRDAVRFKRFEAAGHLIGELFEQIFKRWISSEQSACLERDNLIIAAHATQYISRKIMFCFSTGNWGAPFSKFIRLGVSQPRCNMSALGALSHIQRFSNPQSRETKNLQVRQLDPAHFGWLCCIDSPEGAQVGIVGNFAVSARISRVSPSVIVYDSIMKLDSLIKPFRFGEEYVSILTINGRPYGMVDRVDELIDLFKKCRLRGDFDLTCSIGISDREIQIWTDAGRLFRPVWSNDYDVGRTSDWQTELSSGRAQLIDSFEEEFLGQFSWDRELDPSMMFGITAATIPLINHQPPVRGMFGAAMIKQAVSLLGIDQNERLDTTAHVADRTEMPLVFTKAQKILKLDQTPLGVNLIVAIRPFDGGNQEDAVVLNRATVERGMFRGHILKTHQACQSNDGSTMVDIALPALENRQPQVNYCLLEPDGLPRLGAEVLIGDAIIGSVARSNQKSKCVSIVASRGEDGTVIRVLKMENEGKLVVKVVIRKRLEMVSGNKFSSRFAQKGIVGTIVPSWEMPFCEDGTIPDMLINPLCLPSRMTIPTLIESMFGLWCLETRQKIELPNSFVPIGEHEKIKNELESFGIDSSCLKKMYCPKTFESCLVTIAPMYYLWLAHFAEPKCYARDTGIRSKQTRQPTDGRTKQGGLRFGEMERDAAVTMPHLLDDRLFWSSDAFWVPVCRTCHQIAVNDEKCLCGANKIQRVKLAFTNHMVFNLMRAMGTRLDFMLEKQIEIKQIENIDIDEEEEEEEIDEEDQEEELEDELDSDYDMISDQGIESGGESE